MKNGRSYLLLSVLLGLVAAGGAAWYLSRAEAAAAPTEPVVIARGTIPARTLVTEDLLTIKQLPKAAVHPEAEGSMASFVGKTTRSRIAAGEQLLASKVFRDRAETGASFVLPEGRRAVAVSVNELIAAGGLVVPGDKVDVVGSCLVNLRPVDGSQKQEQIERLEPAPRVTRAAYTLQGLEILAVAQEMVGDEALTPQTAFRAQDARGALDVTRSPAPQPMAKTVTLAVTPEESARLILLENHPDCRLRFALRAAGDQSRATPGILDFDPASSMNPVVRPD